MKEEMYQLDLLFILMQKDIDVRKDNKMVTRKCPIRETIPE